MTGAGRRWPGGVDRHASRRVHNGTMSGPIYTGTGTVAAPPDRTWPALLRSLHYVPAKAAEKIIGSTGTTRQWVPLPADEGGAMAGHVTVKADSARRTVSVKGRWWYKGVFSVEPHPEGSLVRYEVFNAASPLTRWAVPLVASRGVRPRLDAELAEALRQTAQRV